MEIRFYCIQNGKKFYRVMLHGEDIFCGTKGECQRFIKIHNEKVNRALVDAPAFRARPGNVRVYRRRVGSPGL